MGRSWFTASLAEGRDSKREDAGEFRCSIGDFIWRGMLTRLPSSNDGLCGPRRCLVLRLPLMSARLVQQPRIGRNLSLRRWLKLNSFSDQAC